VSPNEKLSSPLNKARNQIEVMEDMYYYPEKFVRKGPFWSMSKKQKYLSKLIMHSNGVVVEPGGREHRNQELNPRFDYQESLEMGDPELSLEEQQLLAMQPTTYTVYLNNLAQTVSRSLAGVDEVITGLDTQWAGGSHAM